jgi:preprotein translocase subunit SecA
MGAAADTLSRTLQAMRGAPVEYNLARYRRVLADIRGVDVAGLSDADLTARARACGARARDGEPLDDLLAEFFALGAEACARTVGLRPFDVQLMAGVALHQGKVAQLATGEGKTLVAVLPAALRALQGRGVHILTANDYLARRDAAWMGPVYRALGLSVASVGQGDSPDARRAAYASDITYVTAKEAGFDFLRDHVATEPARLVQRPFHYAIVDEADFILVDEARVPLVIAGETDGQAIDHPALAAAARALRPGEDYRTDEYQRNVTITDTGFREAERLLGCGPLLDPGRHLLLAAVHVALHAEVLLRRGRCNRGRGGAGGRVHGARG